MHDDQQGFTLSGVRCPLPDDDLRKKREAAVVKHTVAEAAWDVDGVLAALPRCGAYRILPFEERPLVGDEEIRGYFESMKTAFPDLDHEVLSVHHTADAVIREGRIRGTQAADWRDVPNKGKRMSVPVAVFSHFDDDVLVDETVYYDHAIAVRQLS